MALQNITQKEFIKALKKNRFNVSKACEIVGVSRQAHYQWLENDEVYKQAYSELTESVLDIAEESLLELVQGAYKEVIDKDNQVRVLKEPPHAQSVMYLLDRLGKKRGYVNKETIDNDNVLIINRNIIKK